MAISPPPVQQEEERRHQLNVMKRRATGLLVVMGAVFVVLILTLDDRGAGGYLRAAAEASLVGGLADWFAVTALFRHPLGLPIPHTAVIRERKDQFGRTLGDFVQQNFLSPDVVVDRLRGTAIPRRLGTWMADEANAHTLARHAADLAVTGADLVRDDDVQQLIHEQLNRFVESVPLAPLAARALQAATADGRHHDLVDAALGAIDGALDAHGPRLREQFGKQSPWWLPGAVEDRVFDRLLDGVHKVVAEVIADREHPYRAQFDAWLAGVIGRLETDPALRARGEQLKRDLLTQPALRMWSSTIWRDAKAALRTQAGDPESELRRRLADGVCTAGARLRDDPVLQRTVQEAIESGVRYLGEHFRDELADLISGTIARWDAEETSDKLELLLGRDLQFIRINGTVVGGLAGVAIHAIAETVG